MLQGPGAIKKAWYQWRMMRFPWRKKWLVGFDLQGNTFWEFKDALHQLRNRRIAKYSRSTHYGDVNISPSWMQWLRHTRFEPPSMVEQQQEVMRQDRIRMLAAQADARWAAKRSALDAPDKQQPIQMLKSKDPDSGIVQMNANQDVRDRSEAQVTEEAQTTSQPSAQSQNMPQDPPEPPAAEGAPTLQTRKWMKKEPKDSPWNKARQAGPGEDWQPRGWSPAPNKRRA